MLDLAGVPLFAKERTESHPLVIGGGPCTCNGEPVAPFFDAMVIGEGEEVVSEITDVIIEWKGAGGSRGELLDKLAGISGVYVPSFFEPKYDANGRLAAMEPKKPGYERVRRRLLADLNDSPQPARTIVPFMQTVHDRLPIEIQRGCTRGCRFCQGGMINRPARQRAPGDVLTFAEQGLRSTGYEEVGFLSLSAGDYACLNPLLVDFFERFAPERIAISLPSLRTETMNDRLAAQIAQVKKTGFTVAPEAATDRLRRVINKGNAEADLLAAMESIFRAGWSLLKLYFMIGLPTETEEDVRAIAELSFRALRAAKKIRPDAQVKVSVSTFVPKAFTPFQWERMIGLEETIHKHDVLRAAFPRKGALAYKYHEAKGSMVEGLLTRGDRRVATAVLAAWRQGQVLDSWTEHFSYERWLTAVEALQQEHGVGWDFYLRERAEDEVLPWDRIEMGPTRDWLLRQRHDSRAEASLPDCAGAGCSACGVCDHIDIKPRVYAEADYVSPGPAPVPSPVTQSGEGQGSKAEGAEAPVRHRVRVRYSKTGQAIAISHLEVIALLLRTLRRTGLPVAFTQGFSPRPRVSFSPACPVGIESKAEFADIDLLSQAEPQEVAAALGRELPPDFKVLDVQPLPARAESLNNAIVELSYRAVFPEQTNPETLFQAIEAFLSADRWEVVRHKAREDKRIDLKQAVTFVSAAGVREVVFGLRSGNVASAKPSEVVAGLFGTTAVRIEKEQARFAEQPGPDAAGDLETAS